MALLPASKEDNTAHAPSKEEKLQRVQEIASEIAGLRCNGDVEVMFLDESHFSTDPYVVRGWSKRGQPFFPPDSDKTRELHDIGAYAPGNDGFY